MLTNTNKNVFLLIENVQTNEEILYFRDIKIKIVIFGSVQDKSIKKFMHLNDQEL